MEDARSFRELILPVPASDDILHAWIKRALCQANEEANDDEVLDILRGREREGQNRPDDLSLRQYPGPTPCVRHIKRTSIDGIHIWAGILVSRMLLGN